MWSIIQSVLDFVIQNSDYIAGLLAMFVGYKAGVVGWVLKKALSALLKFLGKEGKDLAQSGQDKDISKEGEPLKPQIPAEYTPEVKQDVIQKRKSWFKRIIRGK